MIEQCWRDTSTSWWKAVILQLFLCNKYEVVDCVLHMPLLVPKPALDLLGVLCRMELAKTQKVPFATTLINI